MPKRNRVKEQRKLSGPAGPAVVAPVVDEAARAAQLFVASVKAHEAADRDTEQRAREADERRQHHQQLREAKDAAADRIKRLRASGGGREQLAQADATYRLALAELQEFETGERPHWAPAPDPAPDSGSSADGGQGGHDEREFPEDGSDQAS